MSDDTMHPDTKRDYEHNILMRAIAKVIGHHCNRCTEVSAVDLLIQKKVREWLEENPQ